MGFTDLKSHILPPALIVKDLLTDVNSEPLYVYEDWIRELVNASPAFLNKSGGEVFQAPESEAHGECDAVTSRYSVDFKMVLSWSAFRMLSDYSIRQRYCSNGRVLGLISKRCGETRGVKLHAALRGFSADQLQALWVSDINDYRGDEISRDVIRFLKSLDRDKHLLLLYPLLLFEDDDLQAPVDEVREAIYADFEAALSIRRQRHPSFDTYLSYCCNGQLIIDQVLQCGAVHFDSVPVTKSAVFMDICKHCYFDCPWIETFIEMSGI